MADFINTADVIGDEEMCDQIIERTVTEYNENRITKVGDYAFYNCTALETVKLPNVKEIMKYAFGLCTSLTELTENQFPSVETIQNGAFEGCSGITTIVLPKVTGINGGITKSNALLNVILPNADAVNNGVSISFGNCPNLETVLVPKLRYFSEYGGYTFQNCKKLKNVDFSSLTRINPNMFEGCSALTALDFPKLTAINGQKCFGTCSALVTLILRSETMCTLGNTNALESTPFAGGTGYIYVPSALVDSYKEATNWSTYAAQFRALEDYTVDGTTTGELDETKIQ